MIIAAASLSVPTPLPTLRRAKVKAQRRIAAHRCHMPMRRFRIWTCADIHEGAAGMSDALGDEQCAGWDEAKWLSVGCAPRALCVARFRDARWANGARRLTRGAGQAERRVRDAGRHGL